MHPLSEYEETSMRRRGGPVAWAVAVVAFLVFLPVAAYGAYLTIGSGSGSTAAASLPAPGKPTITVSNSGLSIGWTSTALSTGRAVDSYQLRRTIGAATTTVCTTTSLTCTDSKPNQTATYAVVAKVSNWSSSSASTQYVPDTTPPTITNLALSADTGSSSTDFITDVAVQKLNGKTEAGAAVSVVYNGVTTSGNADSAGNFSIDLTLALGTRNAVVTATDQAGNTASVIRSITLNAASTPASTVVVSGNTDTAVQDLDWQISGNPTGQFCVTATLTGTSATPKAWQLLVHLDKPPFYGGTPNDLFYSGSSQVNIAAVAGDSTLARITGSSSPGNPWNQAWNNALLDTTRTLSITLCDSNPRTPTPGNPSWYTATTTQGTQSSNQACVKLTVTAIVDEDDNPFYFGWQASVNLVAAKQYLINSGKTINFVSWNPDPSGGFQFTTSPTASQPVADSYALTSGRNTPVKAGDTETITACVHAF